MEGRSFPRPSDIEAPPGAEGWEEFYPYYHLFGSERRASDDERFWFRDSLHHPEALYPFDAITAECWWVGLGEYASRVFMLPAVLGIDQRILNGYLYASPNVVQDEAEVQARSAIFKERAGFYYDHWDDLSAKWDTKAEAAIRELVGIRVVDLPVIEPASVVTEARGLTSAYDLVEAFELLILSLQKVWHYHFEMLNLGYAAYVTFFEFCQKAFPQIPEQSIAKMIAGIEMLSFRPDEELQRLARLAIDFGIADVFSGDASAASRLGLLDSSPAGIRWREELERVRDPWFHFSIGTGFSHTDGTWNDDLSVPLDTIGHYVKRLRDGETIGRPLGALREEGERTASAYRAMLAVDADRRAFDDLLALTRRVFPYIENHNFYIEHWHHSIFWNKVREFGRVLAGREFFADPEDIFFLNRHEIAQCLFDATASWAAGTQARGALYWPPRIQRRKAIYKALRAWDPPALLGKPPDKILDPLVIMLWGVTVPCAGKWVELPEPSGATPAVRGAAASPGVGEGPARVLTDASQIREVRDGEILVCAFTSPAWTQAFTRVRGVVSDVGGIMSHAAIVCREYGLPAVVNTGVGTSTFRTGQWIRVDGNRGIVTPVEGRESDGKPSEET